MLFEKLIKQIGVVKRSSMNKKAFVIAIEGTDRSGKETHSKLLADRLSDLGLSVKLFSFPDYNSESSDFVKRYLSGVYGDVDDVNEYQASLMYAIDRLHIYFTELKSAMDEYDVIIFDRYVGSNLIHQTCKIKDCNSEWDEAVKKQKFVEFWSDFEFNKLGLPKPDYTILLDMPIEDGKKVAKARDNKITGESDQDIHESNDDYMHKAYNMAHAVAEHQGWCIIPCTKKSLLGRRVRSIRSISNDIFKLITFIYFADCGVRFDALFENIFLSTNIM